ncbi:hypothetical protein [Streptomyces xanthophaeus]|uniref:hypothetical protein n=1 Tax=Streptomyces xanthophaeus TaxID=67385 RepID=UPI00365F7683
MTQPTALPETNPLPRLGDCPGCFEEIRVRVDGTLQQHRRYGARCPGSRRPVGLLEPTFSRWLHANAPRKDARTNRVTRLAQMTFHGCTRSPKRTPADMTWTTAEELHEDWHRRLVDLSGDPERANTSGEHCDWLCQDIVRAATAYAGLIATVVVVAALAKNTA